MMDYPCGKFGDCSIVVLVLSCRQTDTQRHRQTWMNALSPVSTTRVDGPS